MPISDPHWPPDEYHSDLFPPPWLRFGKEYPGSKRPSRLVEHATIPYVVEIDGEDAEDFLPESLKTVTGQYLRRLSQFLDDDEIAVPPAWRPHLTLSPGTLPPANDAAATIHWLDIWPPIGGQATSEVPLIASWNLCRNDNHALPGPIVMVATEVYSANGTIVGFDSGVRVPIVVEAHGTPARPQFRVIIRSMTAEFPSVGRQSATELLKAVTPGEFPDLGDALISGMADRTLKPDILEKIATTARVAPRSIRHNQITFMWPSVPRVAGDPITIRLMSHAVRTGRGHPTPESVQVISDIRFSPGQDPQVIRNQTCALATHAASPGEAMVFSEVPSSSPMHLGIDHPYNWMQRRPARKDSVFTRYRAVRDFAGGINLSLENAGFKVRLCPWYVPDDDAPAKAGETVKTVRLTGGQDPLPRRNDFSAISAYASCVDFFDMMASFGHPPDSFVARAQQDLQVFYRWGISPGPGRSGRTINAQVTYQCLEEEEADGNGDEIPPKPFINIHLALANLNRFSRPEKDDGTFARPEPLGIAVSGRWMMHEFGHYLLAARIGKLEFDFAHSAGDAMAAIYYDPRSSLNRATPEISGKFRGITYPFVFAPRRHDRSPLSGWAWYGLLNRAILLAPPADCHVTKGYLTEQILSSTLFRLYRSLGGDTIKLGASDVAVRKRAAHITFFLLIRAIAGLAQSPSRAEMLELGMENASRQMQLPLTMPSDVTGLPAWRGGQAQKVVRWAFEAQGMFPIDPEVVSNKAGQPPMVDIYVADQRPDQVRTSAGREVYGPGSYEPVSLDWGGARLWAVAPHTSFQIGNRGSAPSGGVLARFWIGLAKPDLTAGPNQQIDWVVQSNFFSLPEPNPGNSLNVNLSDLPNLSAELQNLSPAVTHKPIVLLEISCQSDIANTFPLADGMVSIAPGTPPPNNPRELIDLVSSDNNLGLMFLD